MSRMTLAQRKAKAEAYVAEGKYGWAARILRVAARQGDAEAQFQLAGCLYEIESIFVPEGVEREFVHWYRQASAQGYVPAQYELAQCFYYGNGVQQNYPQAAFHYKAIPMGNYPFIPTDELMRIGDAFRYGHDEFPEEDAEAVRWYAMAAERDVTEAFYELGFCYCYGCGVEEDEEKGIRLLKKAARRNHADASYYIAHVYTFFLEGKGHRRKAVRWYRKAAELGHAEAMFRMAVLYADGDGVRKDLDEAARWIRELQKTRILTDSGKEKLVARGIPFEEK